MTLIKFDPMRGFDSVARRMNKIMNEFDKGISVETGGFNPRFDITEDENNIFFNAEFPGMKKEDIKISMSEDRTITFTGEKKADEELKDKTFVRVERTFGEFSRSFMLPETADLGNVKAKFENGILEVTIAKKEPEQPKDIEVEIS